MTDWRQRLTTRLEPDLESTDPRPAISTYHDMPFAIFHYPPSEEFPLRGELSLMRTRLEQKGKKITTIEGLPASHPVKKAWIQEQVPQCGWCQPGIMMQVASLIAESKNPDPNKIIGAMDDVLCRCGSYPRMKKGIKTAVNLTKKGGKTS